MSYGTCLRSNIFSVKSKISNFHIALLFVVVVFEVAIHYYLSLSLFQRISYLGPTLLSLLPTSTADDAVRENQNEPGKVC